MMTRKRSTVKLGKVKREEIGDHSGSLFGATLLIAGTCVGAGILALPIVTGLAGLYPTLIVNLICWLYMLATGLLFLEATLWLPDGANVLSITKKLLGRIGEGAGGVFFLFLYYCLMVSYLSGGASLFSLSIHVNPSLGFALFTGFFILLVFAGAYVADHVNWLLMGGLVLTYIFIIGLGIEEVNLSNFTHQDWSLSLFAFPVLFSAYGYHNIIPTLSTYLNRDKNKLRSAIFLGTTIPFMIYTLWQMLILGIVPMLVLREANALGEPVSQILLAATRNPWVGRMAVAFGFFAIVTSLLGVALSMVDFLGDAFVCRRVGFPRLLLTLLVFLPPAVISFFHTGIFIEALGIAGGFGEAFLNGILPIALVWSGRYHLKLAREDLLPGGRLFLFLLTLFTLFIIAIEIDHLFF